jgi:hypothetical protein
MPDQAEIYRLAEDDPVFRQKYTRAREFQGHGCFDLLLEKANDEEKDPTRLRIQIDALKWAASKLLPKKYGDKIEVSGAVGFVPLNDLLAKAQEIRERESLAFGEDVIEGEILSKELTAPENPTE